MIGKLDERISLQRATLIADGQGGQSESWTEYAEVWASVRPMKGMERQASQREEAISDYLVTVRYLDDILDSDRIVWRGRQLNIRFKRDAGPRAQYLEIEAELGAAS